jgi:cell division protein FtsW
MVKKLRTDWFLFAIAMGLALFGAVMVYSASAMISLQETAKNPEGASQFFYFYKQFGFTVLGLVVMFATSKIDYRLYQNKTIVYGILGFTAILLLAVYGFPSINGARRWIRFAGVSFQPSEIAKIAIPIFFAYFLTEKEDAVGELKETVMPCALVLGFFGALVMFEPDLGTTMVLCVIFITVYFAAGAKWLHIVLTVAGLLAVGVAALILSPWRMKRLFSFLNPWENSTDGSYQVVQGLYAIGSGGIFGEGFAKGQQKLFYLPYPYSDFIFAVVGEEFGLLGTLAVTIAFGLLLWRGTRAAMLAPDRFGMLLGIGIITGIVVQALFNISVVISILPAKGIPLPFISYGGSSIVVTLFAVGILLNISQHAGSVALKVDVRRDDFENSPRRRRGGKTGLK